jgi:hypothetical protein
LVVSPTSLGGRPGARSIIAVDTATNQVIEAQRDFRGRIPTAVR